MAPNADSQTLAETHSTYAWNPTSEYAARTRVMRFARDHGIDDYWELVRRSVDEPEWFWDAVVRWLGLEFTEPYRPVLDVSGGIEWPIWFCGGRLNAAWNCVGRWARDTPDALAISAESEDGELRRLTYAELWREVCRLANGLSSLGIEAGDRVALYLPMLAEAAVASHACALIGAVQVPLFSGLAANAIAARLIDGEVKAVICDDGGLRRGQVHNLKETLDNAIADLQFVERVIVKQRFPDRQLGDRTSRDISWEELVADQPTGREPEAFDSEHPHCLVYTSGTTGRPKGIVHATAGLLVKIAAEAAFQTDVNPGDHLYWVTDLGWMIATGMLVGAGANGAAAVACEGLATVPPDRLWAQVQRHRVTILGISPTLVRILMSFGEEPVRQHDLSTLRIIASSGEPWNPGPYRWLSAVVGERKRPIINISGGTEVGTCFLSPSAAIPIKECSVGGPSLGMAVDVIDAAGNPVRGEIGELICRKPWPAMTRGIWRDRERYLDAYWRQNPGVWTHGDLALVDEDGYWFLFGRSDDTLNVAGKRVGPAELESVLVEHPAVVEAGVVGIPDELKGEVAWAFCVPSPQADPSEELAAELRALVGAQLGKSYEPQRVIFVSALPKTRSAKIVRRSMRALVLGEDPGDLSSLEDPGVLESVKAAVRNAQRTGKRNELPDRLAH
jgi:acetyl-CoA synthetase